MRSRFILALPMFLIPVAFAVLKNDAPYFLVWWSAITLLGIAWWPVASAVFPQADYGWLFAKGLGLAFSALIAFLLQHINSLFANRPVMLFVLLLTAVSIWFFPVKNLKNNQSKSLHAGIVSLKAADGDNAWPAIAVLELLFGFALLFWTFARGLKPELDSLEKFMNLGFMNSIWRSGKLPASDIWFSGSSINYYYFGHYVYAWLAKICSIQTTIAYQLGMATTFAMTAALSGSLVLHLLFKKPDIRIRPQKAGKNNIPAWLGALLAVLLVVFGGNSHAFWFSEKSPGNYILRRIILDKSSIGDPDKIFWFADSTRYIGYNPATSDKTIHEFPYYSFLVADLHAHLINLAFVLVLLGALAYLVRRSSNRAFYKNSNTSFVHHAKNIITDPVYLLLSLLLAIFMMANYWDFIIYFMLSSFVILIVGLRGYADRNLNRHRHLNKRDIISFPAQMLLLLMIFLYQDNPLLSVILIFTAFGINSFLFYMSSGPLTWAGARASWIFFLSHLLALPFNNGFEPIAKKISLTVDSTPAGQFLILWGTHVFCGLVLLIFMLIRNRQPGPGNIFPLPHNHYYRAYTDNRPLFTRIRANLLKLDDSAALIAGFYLMGLFLLLLPELFYVVDIYSGEFKRANTMFKFTYQAFVLLSIVWSFAVPRLLREKRGSLIINRIIAFLLALLMIIPLWYPFAATSQWLGVFKRENYMGLDAMHLFALKDSRQIEGSRPGELADDVAAINWLNENVSGQPVVLEAYGDSYTDYNRISVFTGLPTIIGWQTHEWLWRTSKNQPDAYTNFVLPRQKAVEVIYTTDDQLQRKALLQQYNVEYIVTGALEHEKFSIINDDGSRSSLVRYSQLLDTGRVVFESGELSIIKVEN
jgi:YYY domain-containing protein